MTEQELKRRMLKALIFIIVMAFLGFTLNVHFIPLLINQNNWLAFYAAILLCTVYVVGWIIGFMWLCGTKRSK